jgi:hypothetical protein
VIRRLGLLQLDFVTVVGSGVRIMFSRPQEKMAGTARSASKRPVEMYVEVEDVESYHDTPPPGLPNLDPLARWIAIGVIPQLAIRSR